MIELINKAYNSLNKKKLADLFFLRKKIFNDRLNWAVNCTKNSESDEYDNANTTYVLGTFNKKILCSVRFIETRNHNMITGTFIKYFDKNIELPKGNFIEASRLFVDKNRLDGFGLRGYPVSIILFLSMINYARSFNYDAIYSIVSHQMYMIFIKSGWEVKIIASGISEKNERIHLIIMPVDKLNRSKLIKKIIAYNNCNEHKLTKWPLTIPLKGKQAE